MKTCIIEKCDKKVSARGLCWNHYHREYRRGSFHDSECAASWCNKPAKGKSGKSRLCNSCYMKLRQYEIDFDSFINLPNQCEVCGGSYRLSIDHNHETNKVRGVLCSYCNPALGLLKEDISIMNKLISYTEKHS